MAEYRLTFARSARRELERLDPPIARRVLAAIEKLSCTPRPVGCIKLSGSIDEWRIRIGDWRVIYVVSDGDRVVDVMAVRHRSDAYR